MVEAGSTVPVGLLGLHTNTMIGANSAIRARSASGSTEKSACRLPATTSVPVIRAMWECSAYVGSNIAALHPGHRR